MKKGTWVTFKLRNEEKTGLVIKGGKQVTVAFNHTANGYKTVKGIPQHFQETSPVKLDDSGIMDSYEIKSYKEAGGEETVRFEAKLYKDKKLIAHVSNSGYGESDRYDAVMIVVDNKKVTTHNEINQFYEDVKAWAIYHSEEKPFEPEGLWIEWVTSGKVTGQPSKEYWAYHNQTMAEWRKNK